MATAANSSNSPSSPTPLVNHHSSEISNHSITSIGSISITNVAGMIPTKLNRQNYDAPLGLVNGDDLCPPEFVLISSRSRVLNLLYETWCDSSMTYYLNSIKDIFDKLATAGEPIFESDLVAYILSGLLDDYKSFVNFIKTRNESVMANELHDLLVSKKISLQKRKTKAFSSSTAPFHV
ncbi:unnamed protein product [Malus baccata var. baccata]